MNPTQINTVADIENWFTHLIDTEKLNLHPDTPFEDYVHIKTNNRIYSKEQATQLNDRMQRCFEVAESAGTDVYEIGVPILFKNLLQRNLK